MKGLRLSWARAILVAVAAITATPAIVAAQPRHFVRLPLPGGIAALYRAADLTPPAQPSLALLGFIKAVYGSAAAPAARARRYPAVLAEVEAASASLGAAADLARGLAPTREIVLPPGASVPGAVQAWLTACGLVIKLGTVLPAATPDGAARREALEIAGAPVAIWIARLNLRQSIHAEVPGEQVLLPLERGTWISAVFKGRSIAPDALVPAILADSTAACLYYGLMALDDETLDYVASHPRIIEFIGQGNAGIFAEWGRSLRIHNGRVVVPGGEPAEALWTAVIADPGNPEAFIAALFRKDFGKAAFFYDTIAHLDPARQAFALAGASGPQERTRIVRALYSGFLRKEVLETVTGWPRVRRPDDAAALLKQVSVTTTGAMSAPAQRSLWEHVFSGSCTGAGDGDVDASWLVAHLEADAVQKRGERLGAITFAQRVFARAQAADLPAVCEVLVAYPRDQALLLTLERMGFDSPAEYARAVAFADGVFNSPDRRTALVRTAQVQGVLAILERGVTNREVSRSQAHDLVMSLLELQRPPEADIAGWFARTLVTALCRDEASADGCLIRTVSGHGSPGGVPTSLAWEGEQYRIDLGAATAVRVARVRERQRAIAFDPVLAVLAAARVVANPSAGAPALSQAATTLKLLASSLTLDVADVFGQPVPSLGKAIETTSADLAEGRGAAARAESGRALLEAGQVVLAEAFASFAYAVAIGDADAVALLEGDPAPRHRFDSAIGPARPAWSLPQEVKLPDGSWIVEGSLLALRIVYLSSWIRKSSEDAATYPRVEPNDLNAFGESAAAFNAFALTDAGRDALVAAIRKGQARARDLVTSPDQFWKVAREAGVSEWRCRAALIQAADDADRAVDFLSLSELLWLGDAGIPADTLDAWGVAARAIDGSLLLNMPGRHAWEDLQGPRGAGLLPAHLADVHLRVAQALADLHLPAVLAPEVAAYAVWDVVTSTRMSHADDWFAVAHASRVLAADRFFDYVSALTAIGPLVPVTKVRSPESEVGSPRGTGVPARH